MYQKLILAAVTAVAFSMVGRPAMAQDAHRHGTQDCVLKTEYDATKSQLDDANDALAIFKKNCGTLEEVQARGVAGKPGAPGPRGAQGPAGSQGPAGPKGADGKSPTVTKVDVGSAECPAGGVEIVPPNGTAALYLCNGKDGTGYAAAAEPAGTACPAGGVKLTPSDGNAPSYVCNGQKGDKGDPGQSCWDLDGNGTGDVGREDMNADGKVDVMDCIPDSPLADNYLTLYGGLGSGVAFRGSIPAYMFNAAIGITGDLSDHVGIGFFGDAGGFNSATNGWGWDLKGSIGPIFTFDKEERNRLFVGLSATQYGRGKSESPGLTGNGLGYMVGVQTRYLGRIVGPLVAAPYLELGWGHASGYDPVARPLEPFDRATVQGVLGFDLFVAAGVFNKK
ncbi:collagen-like protein [Candidatus Uhrbacteria bacterium]|nr:collagen-like protein [Candidatus Uhrbacteria bacterium]